jgi:hypothetical protein
MQGFGLKNGQKSALFGHPELVEGSGQRIELNTQFEIST